MVVEMVQADVQGKRYISPPEPGTDPLRSFRKFRLGANAELLQVGNNISSYTSAKYDERFGLERVHNESYLYL